MFQQLGSLRIRHFDLRLAEYKIVRTVTTGKKSKSESDGPPKTSLSALSSSSKAFFRTILPEAYTGIQYVRYFLDVEVTLEPQEADCESDDLEWSDQNKFKWTISFRFSELHDLHTRVLAKTFGLLKLPALPPKTTTRRFDGQFLEHRAIQLRRYFKELSAKPEILNGGCSELWRFLEVGENLRNSIS